MTSRFGATMIFTAIAPAAVLIIVPALLLGLEGPIARGGATRLIGLIPMFVGIAVLAWCYAGFIVEGEGTPAPYDPPRRLVTGRLYAWVRNPMYLAIVTVLIGQAMFYASPVLFVWAGVAFLVMHGFVVMHEEPVLLQRFGAPYAEYLERVPRWLPRRPTTITPKPPMRVATLVYALRDGQVLLVRRVSDPNRGLWVAPGGKLDPGESPAECAKREMREETGLEIERPELRVVMTETSPRPDYQWLTFVYLARHFGGTFTPAEGIGEFRWVPVDDVADLPIPPADAIFFPRLLRAEEPPLNAKFEYDADLNLLRWNEE